MLFGRDHNGPDRPQSQRDRATPFLNFKKFPKKSQNSNFKILVHHFLRLCLLCIVEKTGLDSNKTDGGDRF